MTRENVISVKFLIHLVGERPALWDKTSEDYKDRALKETSWREICTYINENYQRLTPKAKDEFTKMIMKKWTHIRDSWVKSMKYGYDEVTKIPPKPYVYHHELEFMQKILKCKPPRYNLNIPQISNVNFEEFYREKNETQLSKGSNSAHDNVTIDNEAFVDLEVEIHKQELNDISNSITECQVGVVNKAEDTDDIDSWHLEDTQLECSVGEQIYKQTASAKKRRQSIFVSAREQDIFEEPKAEEPPRVEQPMIVRPVEIPLTSCPRIQPSLYDNRHWNFFHSILPSLQDLDEDHVLQFQAGVIHLLQNVRESQKQKLVGKSNSATTHSLNKGRGRKRKVSLDNNRDNWSKHKHATRSSSKRHISDLIAAQHDNLESEYSSDE